MWQPCFVSLLHFFGVVRSKEPDLAGAHRDSVKVTVFFTPRHQWLTYQDEGPQLSEAILSGILAEANEDLGGKQRLRRRLRRLSSRKNTITEIMSQETSDGKGNHALIYTGPNCPDLYRST